MALSMADTSIVEILAATAAHSRSGSKAAPSVRTAPPAVTVIRPSSRPKKLVPTA
jgi:hypothetical protein